MNTATRTAPAVAPPTTRPKLLRAIDLGYVLALDPHSVRAWLCPPLRPPVEVSDQITELMNTGHAELRTLGTRLLHDYWVLTSRGRAELDTAVRRSLDFTTDVEPATPPAPGRQVRFRLGDSDHAGVTHGRHDEIQTGAVLDSYDEFVVVHVPGRPFAHIVPAAAVTLVEAPAVPGPPGH